MPMRSKRACAREAVIGGASAGEARAQDAGQQVRGAARVAPERAGRVRELAVRGVPGGGSRAEEHRDRVSEGAVALRERESAGHAEQLFERDRGALVAAPGGDRRAGARGRAFRAAPARRSASRSRSWSSTSRAAASRRRSPGRSVRRPGGRNAARSRRGCGGDAADRSRRRRWRRRRRGAARRAPSAAAGETRSPAGQGIPERSGGAGPGSNPCARSSPALAPTASAQPRPSRYTAVLRPRPCQSELAVRSPRSTRERSQENQPRSSASSDSGVRPATKTPEQSTFAA